MWSKNREEDRNAHGFFGWLPPGYYLDTSEPNLRLLKRFDGATVRAFLPELGTKEELQQTAISDYRGQGDQGNNGGHRGGHSEGR